jgi:type II secretory pathway component PulF
MHRDFSAMLALLLDAEVPEARAVTLAAESTASGILVRRSKAVVEDLQRGVKLTEALRHLDDAGEFKWRLANACQTPGRFWSALAGWREALDAQAFQQEQAAAQVITTLFVLFNGLIVGIIVTGVFSILIGIIDEGVLW